MSTDWLMTPGLPFWPGVPWWAVFLMGLAAGSTFGFVLRKLRTRSGRS